MLEYLTNYGQQNISIVSLVISIIIATGIGLGMVWVYRYTHKALTYDRSFLVTLLLMGPIIALIITVIGNNIALSIGHVDSLSIIRFRTVIKDSRDLIFLLWGIAIGLGSGTENWAPTVVSSIVLGMIIVIVHVIRYGDTNRRDLVLVVHGAEKEIERDARTILDAMGFIYRLRSMDMSAGSWQLVFDLENQESQELDLQQAMEKLESAPKIERASLMAPNLTLPV